MTRFNPGHHIFDNFFRRMEMVRMLEALSTADVDRTKAGARHVMAVPVVRDLASDSRMLRIAREFLGPTAVPFRATLFDKSPGANWLVACRLTSSSWWPETKR